MAGSASPRTRFGHPIQTTTGEWSALWMGDKITVESRSGSRALCRVEWGENIHGKPHSLRAWLPKRQIRFSRQNATVQPPAGDTPETSTPQ